MHYKYLVLGAGVSGLSFVNAIDSNDYLIIEKEDKAGGYCKTTKRGEYVWDYAGHFFHFANSDIRSKFEDIISSKDTVIREKTTKIFYKNQYVDYPFQKNIHQLEKDELIDCIYDLFKREEKSNYGSFLDMLYGKFGESITEKFLRPYNEKLYACNLNFLDVDAMGRFFPYADTKEIVLNMKNSNNTSYNQTFLYPKEGAEVFVNKLLESVRQDGIKFNEEVIKIDLEERRVLTNKDKYSFDYLISSIPLNEFVDKSELDLNSDKEVFSFNQVLVLNLGFDRPPIDKSIHWIYVPSKEYNFYRVGFYNNIIGSDKMSLYVEIGYSQTSKISKTDINSQLEQTLEGLKRIGIIEDHELIDYESIVMNPAYVHITKESTVAVKNIIEDLEKNNIFLLGRYGRWKYCSIEDCMLDAMEAVEKIKNK